MGPARFISFTLKNDRDQEMVEFINLNTLRRATILEDCVEFYIDHPFDSILRVRKCDDPVAYEAVRSYLLRLRKEEGCYW